MAKKNSLAKKVFIAVCATLISSFILGSISSLLKKDDDDHTHKWDSGEVTIPASCYLDGEIVYECDCGKTKREVLPAGHVDADGDFLCDNCFNSLAESSGNINGAGTYYIFIPEYYRDSSFDVCSNLFYFGSLTYNKVKAGIVLGNSRFLNLENAIRFSTEDDYVKVVVTDDLVHDTDYDEDFVASDGLFIDFMMIEGYQVYKVI